MNFRSDHSESASKYFVIPSGTQLTVTEVYGTWGKTTYKGRTGWLSLEYSTYVSSPGGSTAPTTNASMLAGDADGDGAVSSADARLILRHCVALERISAAYQARADVNGDGKLTPEDARIVLRKSVHLE